MPKRKPPKRPRGRPPLTPDAGKRSSFTTRIRTELRELLEEQAGGAGRSLSEEIEFRLETSVRDQDVLTHVFGGQHNLALLRVISSAISAIEAKNGARWIDDVNVLAEVHSAASSVLDAYLAAVGGKTPLLPPTRRAFDPKWDVFAALVVADELTSNSDSEKKQQLAQTVFERLLKQKLSLDG